jgi:alpha-L-fucosidase
MKKHIIYCLVLFFLLGGSYRELKAQNTAKKRNNISSVIEILPPGPILPVPTPEQIQWQKMETYAFIHFGLNTFNNLEWGFGDTPASTFNPTDLDCNQWVSILKAGGMKGVILTAKHHDGFCLWPTKTTEYSVKNSPWRNGKGDMVKELSDACKRQGLKFGIYLSPWDRHSALYGKEEYVKIYHEQIKELISNYGPLFEYWFDGANGGDGWYGGANETRSIDPKTYYQFNKAVEMIKAKHPTVIIFGGTNPESRWIGNESGIAGETNWSPLTFGVGLSSFRNGMKDGKQWLPSEGDVSIRPGWFYHPSEDKQVRSVGNLINLYYQTVGRNSNFLLNFPVALNGKIYPVDSTRILEWHKAMKNELKVNVLKGAKVTASNTRGKLYSAANVTDGNWDSYWATSDGVNQGVLTINLNKPTAINRLMLQEYITLGQRVASFNVEIKSNGKWSGIVTKDTISTVGYKRILRFSTVKASSLRINFTDAKGPLCINNIEAYLAPLLMEEPKITRNEKDIVKIEASNGGTELYYTTDGTDPTSRSAKLYSQPFVFMQKGVVKAISYDRQQNKKSPVGTHIFDIPSSSYKVIGFDDKGTTKMFDGNGYYGYYLPEGKDELVIALKNIETIRGFIYTPNRGGNHGYIDHYEFYVDDKMVASGQFSNIKSNPIEQLITFAPIKGQKVCLKATHILDGAKQISIGQFSLLTVEE